MLTWWCDDYAKRGIPFSLTLAAQTLGPDSGAALQRCRLALARVDTVESQQEVDLDAAR